MMKVKEAIKLLIDNGFELVHRKSSHMKFAKDKLRVMIVDGGWHGTGELHSKEVKEVMNAIKGIQNIKEQLKIKDK